MENRESQWLSDDIPYMKWKIIENHPVMFETTNQP
jgi:hypothetical protein